jgi:hypothetical protein
MPNFDSATPKKEFFPNIMRRKKPITVGGSTIGSENIPSANDLSLPADITSLAAIIPKKKVNTVAVKATLTDIHNGEISILPLRINPQLHP